MDPDVALTAITSPTLSLYERIFACDALEAWIINGGFPPTGLRHTETLALCREHRGHLVRTMED